jgi:predicted Rossmann fold flavoprotein
MRRMRRDFDRQQTGRRTSGVIDADSPFSTDVAILGAGAAGLATAILSRRFHPHLSVLLVDSAKRPGAKILVSGGSRCNVTNAAVSDADFWGGRRTIVRRVLRGWPVRDTVAFFHELGVRLHEEGDGKLFPDSNRARDVLNALLTEADRAGVMLAPDHRVADIAPADGGYRIATTRRDIHASRVVLAMGGQSLPKSGSDGSGFALARRLGHTIVPTTPGLVPLLLAGEPQEIHRELQGVAHDAELTLWIDGRVSTRLAGSLLWTHFGISGPVTLNISRHWLRAAADGQRPALTLSFCPGRSFEDVESWWTARATDHPQASVHQSLAALVPVSAAGTLLGRLAIDDRTTLAHLTRDDRRRLVHALVAWPLAVEGSRGYNYAEVTAGGVSLDEIDPSTMASRVRPGLFLVGEILDVDGRIGGFNFQWAWSSARVCAAAVGA